MADMPDEPTNDTPYYLAVRFTDERRAERAYFQAQRYIQQHESELELSVYRFMNEGRSIVAIVGDNPGGEEEVRLNRRLSGGAKTELDENVLRFLLERREQATEQGSWVERHYRPGQGFNLDR